MKLYNFKYNTTMKIINFNFHYTLSSSLFILKHKNSTIFKLEPLKNYYFQRTNLRLLK